MDEGKRKQVGQMVLLAVLLGGLIISFMLMAKSLHPSKPVPKAPGHVEAGRTTPHAKTATDMPDAKAAKAEANQAAADAKGSEQDQMNLNEFKVFALSPQRSPFVQEERWYDDSLTKNLPGYPQLKDHNYFENNQFVLPDIALVTGQDKKWAKVTLSQSASGKGYEISGKSADGSVTTSINLSENDSGNKTVTWTPDSGVPLKALTQPGWEERYPQLTKERAAESSNTNPANSDDLFNGQEPGGLGLPGGDALGDLTTGSASADQISVSGVTLKGGRAAAIVSLNGRTFLVSEGGSLPPRYQVLEVKSNGVVLVDTRDGSSKWIPLNERDNLAPPEPTARPVR